MQQKFSKGILIFLSTALQPVKKYDISARIPEIAECNENATETHERSGIPEVTPIRKETILRTRSRFSVRMRNVNLSLGLECILISLSLYELQVQVMTCQRAHHQLGQTRIAKLIDWATLTGKYVNHSMLLLLLILFNVGFT